VPQSEQLKPNDELELVSSRWALFVFSPSRPVDLLLPLDFALRTGIAE